MKKTMLVFSAFSFLSQCHLLKDKDLPQFLSFLQAIICKYQNYLINEKFVYPIHLGVHKFFVYILCYDCHSLLLYKRLLSKTFILSQKTFFWLSRLPTLWLLNRSKSSLSIPTFFKINPNRPEFARQRQGQKSAR